MCHRYLCVRFLSVLNSVALTKYLDVLERQLKRDNRVQVENALRKAGLLNSDYARNVLQRMPPPQAPRKDTYSNIKFGNEGAFQK